MLLHRCQNTKIALYPLSIVITNIVFDHTNQFRFAAEAFAVVSFPLQDTPEALHRPVVNAFGYTGHTLRHPCLLQLVVEDSVGILKASVAME